MALINEYGLRWHASEVDWGARDVRLLGHGLWRGGVTWAADFSAHRGVYAIYRDGDLYYVGLTTQQGLGTRLKQHLTGRAGDLVEGRKLREQDEFSWFGFDQLHNNRTHDDGLLRTKRLPLARVVDPLESIRDWEAVLILTALPPGNKKNQYPKAVRWTQVKLAETDTVLDRLRRGRG